MADTRIWRRKYTNYGSIFHNRSMHISGMFSEADIESAEADIESAKADIRNKLLTFSDTISEKTVKQSVENKATAIPLALDGGLR